MKTEEQREHNQELACLVDDIGTLKTAALAVIERLEAWIEGERIKINNAHNNIQRECAKNTADNYRYLVDLLTNAVERSK